MVFTERNMGYPAAEKFSISLEPSPKNFDTNPLVLDRFQ
jgi:hypothetical protein